MKTVLLPGLDGTGELFAPLIESLPSDIETLVITYPHDRRLKYGELVDFVMSQLPNNQEFVLVGESFSGPVAYYLALRKPKNLKSIILVASFLKTPRALVLNLCKFLPMSLLLSIPFLRPVVKSNLFGRGVSDHLIDLFKQSISKVPHKVLSFRLGEIAKLPEKIQQCDTRTTYIQPTDDKLVPSTCIEHIKEVMKNLNVFQVNGSHFILQANPTACAEIIANEIHLITMQLETDA